MRGRRPNISREEFTERLESAFKGAAMESGFIPSVEDAISFDTRAGNQPPLVRATAFRRVNEVVGDTELAASMGISVAYAATLGIRNAVIIEGITYPTPYFTEPQPPVAE